MIQAKGREKSNAIYNCQGLMAEGKGPDFDPKSSGKPVKGFK